MGEDSGTIIGSNSLSRHPTVWGVDQIQKDRHSTSRVKVTLFLFLENVLRLFLGDMGMDIFVGKV